MAEFPTTRTHEDAASFWHRYEVPLAQYAARHLRVDRDEAADLARDFCLKQLEREHAGDRPTVHASYAARQARPESRWWPSHGFRRFLGTAFYRYCRDELAKRRGVPALPPGALAELPEESFERDLARLVARDLLASLRDEVLAPWPDAHDVRRRYYTAKWPDEIDAASPADAALEAPLGLTRAELRTAKRHVQDRIVFVLHRRVVDDGWSPEEARRLLAETFAIVDALPEA